MEKKLYSSRELLSEVFEIIAHTGKKISLPENPKAKINSDCCGNETRFGFVFYKKACLAKFRNKEYLIAFGERFGENYLTEWFDCDLCAIPYDSAKKSEEQIAREATYLLEENQYFEYSLMYINGMGDIAFFQKKQYSEKMKKNLDITKLSKNIIKNLRPRKFTDVAADYLAHVVHVVLCP